MFLFDCNKMIIKTGDIPEIVAYRAYMNKHRKWWRRLLRRVSGRRALLHRDTEELLRFVAQQGYLNKVFETIAIRTSYTDACFYSILSQVGKCDKCGWTGTVGEMEPDVDGDGSLGCPLCNSIITVIAPEAE